MAEEQEEVLEMDETMEKVLFYCLDEAQQKKIDNGIFEPFTIVVEGENMHIETFPGEDMESINRDARDQIRTASSFASHYFYCFDGFLDAEDEKGNPLELDTIIVECADQEMEEAYVIGLIYKEEGDEITFEEQPVFIESTPTLFVKKSTKDDDEFAAAQQGMKA